MSNEFDQFISGAAFEEGSYELDNPASDNALAAVSELSPNSGRMNEPPANKQRLFTATAHGQDVLPENGIGLPNIHGHETHLAGQQSAVASPQPPNLEANLPSPNIELDDGVGFDWTENRRKEHGRRCYECTRVNAECKCGPVCKKCTTCYKSLNLDTPTTFDSIRIDTKASRKALLNISTKFDSAADDQSLDPASQYTVEISNIPSVSQPFISAAMMTGPDFENSSFLPEALPETLWCSDGNETEDSSPESQMIAATRDILTWITMITHSKAVRIDIRHIVCISLTRPTEAISMRSNRHLAVLTAINVLHSCLQNLETSVKAFRDLIPDILDYNKAQKEADKSYKPRGLIRRCLRVLLSALHHLRKANWDVAKQEHAHDLKILLEDSKFFAELDRAVFECCGHLAFLECCLGHVTKVGRQMSKNDHHIFTLGESVMELPKPLVIELANNRVLDAQNPPTDATIALYSLSIFDILMVEKNKLDSVATTNKSLAMLQEDHSNKAWSVLDGPWQRQDMTSEERRISIEYHKASVRKLESDIQAQNNSIKSQEDLVRRQKTSTQTQEALIEKNKAVLHEQEILVRKYKADIREQERLLKQGNTGLDVEATPRTPPHLTIVPSDDLFSSGTKTSHALDTPATSRPLTPGRATSRKRHASTESRARLKQPLKEGHVNEDVHTPTTSHD